MTDDQFIFIIKSKLKQFYQENKSVGLDVKKLVAQFRQEIEDDTLQFKYKEQNENRKTNNPPQNFCNGSCAGDVLLPLSWVSGLDL